MPLTWKLSVWGPDLPGYAQVDMLDDNGENHGSTNLTKLAAQGYDIPDISNLPSGQYTPDLRSLLKPGQHAAPAP